MRRVYAFDIDGTLTPIRSSWRFIHIVFNSRIRTRNLAKYFFDGLMSYEEWMALELSLLKGLSAKTFREVIKAIPWRSGIEKLILFRNSNRYDLFIAVTGGFQYLGERAVNELGFNSYIGVEPEVENSILTGLVKKYVDFHGKGDALLGYLSANNIVFDEIICIGDDINDIEMFKVCDISIAFCPTKRVSCNNVDVCINTCSIERLVEVLSFVS